MATTILGVSVTPAFAKQIHRFSNTIGAPGELSLTVASGLAVNETSHDIYVADTGNNRIVEFSAAGAFIRAFGADVGGAGVNICTTGCLTGTDGTSPGSFETPTFLAIDNSGGTSNGDIYVVDSATNVISKFEADGTLVSSWGNNGAAEAANGQLAGKTQAEPFSELGGIAVDSGGTLAVFETSTHLLKFTEDGSLTEEITAPRCCESAARGLSVDGAGNYFKVNGDLSIQKFAPSGADIGEISNGAAGHATGLAANPARDVLYGDFDGDFGTAISAYAFNGAGEVINPTGSCVPQEFTGCPATESFGEGDISNGGSLAVDGSSHPVYGDAVYAVDAGPSSVAVFLAFTLPDVTTNPAEVNSTTTATLKGEVNPLGVQLEECLFEYGETTEYGTTAPCEAPDAEGVGAGNSPVPVHTHLTNLIPGTTYHYRLVAANANGTNTESGDQEFVTGASILSTFVSEVSATAATLNTEINPDGTATNYRFQYVADSAFQLSSYATAAEVPAGGEAIGSGTSPVTRSGQLQGLTPSTTYHFRVLAKNGLGTVVGPDRTFVTQFGGLGFHLADGRAWEMVTPPDKHGAYLVHGGEVHLQASADGNGVAYQSFLSTEVDPEGNRIIEKSMNLAHRNADGSWRSKDVTSPNDHVVASASGNGTEYKLFNPDLSEALLQPRSGTPLSPEASERTPYLRQNTEPPAYTPLVTGKEPYANVPSDTEFGGGEYLDEAVRIVGVSPNFRHFALQSEVPLVEGASASLPSTLYEWSGGQISQVSKLPAAEGGALAGEAKLGSDKGSVRGAVSDDGSRVFWSVRSGEGFTALYVRDTVAEESARLDVKQPGADGLGIKQPIFQGASANGQIVYFTDSQHLTEDASTEGSDLYRCELPPGGIISGCPDGLLIDISSPSQTSEDAEVRGIAAAITADGSKIYFVANGVLDESPNRLGESAVSGQPNLYLWQQDEGVRFIATLSEEDETDWGFSPSGPAGNVGGLSAIASPSGRYLAFMSQRSLTGYDNRDAESGEATQEVFRYDALADRLECLSCNPTGASPRSVLAAGKEDETLVNPSGLWLGQQVAASLPNPNTISLNGISLYHPRAMLDNGRAFFNSIDSLVPADSNGQWDVYQYEPVGVGDCSTNSGGASISRSAGGCVSLVSSGTAEEEAAFLDASETGNDAFFFTPAQLNETDPDHQVDLYDARVNGIPGTLPKITECLGEACQSAARPPNDPTPASAAFTGAGNVHSAAAKHCPKGKRRVRRHGRVRCVSRKHRGKRRKHRRERTEGRRTGR